MCCRVCALCVCVRVLCVRTLHPLHSVSLMWFELVDLFHSERERERERERDRDRERERES